MANPAAFTRRPITADSAIMNPVENILALKGSLSCLAMSSLCAAGQQLQIFNIDRKERIKACQMSEEVVFWKWISNRVLGLVTGTSVYHWSLDDTSDPQKIFERHSSLADCQIINYRCDKSRKWLCIVGIAQRVRLDYHLSADKPQEGRIAGAMQLYSVDRKVSQAIEGHCCGFASFTSDGAPQPSTLFSFAKRTPTESKLYIIEVEKPETNPPFQRKAVDLYFPPEAAADFPVAMQISEKYGVIYLITKFGYISIMDLETGALIYRNRISPETIFVTSLHTASGGIMGVDKKGRVWVVDDTYLRFRFSWSPLMRPMWCPTSAPN